MGNDPSDLPNSHGHTPIDKDRYGNPVYGYDDQGRPIYGYNAEDEPICNGRNIQPKKVRSRFKPYCESTKRMDNGRCRIHKGKAVSGPLHPNYEHGEKSKTVLGLRAIQNRLVQSRGKDPGAKHLLDKSMDKIEDIVDGENEGLALKAAMHVTELGSKENPMVISDVKGYECAVRALVKIFNPTDEQFEAWLAAYRIEAQSLIV